MTWLFFLLALAALAVAFQTTSMTLMLLCLLVALTLALTGAVRLLSARIGSRSRGESLELDPDELRRLREQAEARNLAASQSEPPR